LLYVALTRALEILIVTCSKKNEFIERMAESGDVEGMQAEKRIVLHQLISTIKHFFQ